MVEQQLMYDQSSIFIVALLFIAILIANEIGFRVGRFFQRVSSSEVKMQASAIQGGILGLLALLLGFTFNMALQRFDNRSLAQIHEANAIGTTILRASLLPDDLVNKMKDRLSDYVDIRIKLSSIDLTQFQERKSLNQQTNAIQKDIWHLATTAAEIDPRPATTGLFITALNEMIDMQGKRNAILQQFIPEVILFLLFAVLIATGALLGYSSGLALKRTLLPTSVMILLITMVIFIIIDLDRPKRGIIKVSQEDLHSLKELNIGN